MNQSWAGKETKDGPSDSEEPSKGGKRNLANFGWSLISLGKFMTSSSVGQKRGLYLYLCFLLAFLSIWELLPVRDVTRIITWKWFSLIPFMTAIMGDWI